MSLLVKNSVLIAHVIRVLVWVVTYHLVPYLLEYKTWVFH